MSTRAVSKLTSKYQTTVPAPVREALCLEKGDSLVFEIADDGAVSVRKAVPLDEAFASALRSLLSEWDSSRGRRGLPWPLSSGRWSSSRSRSRTGAARAAAAGAGRLAPRGARQRDRPQRPRDDHERRPPPLAARRAGLATSTAAGLPAPSVVRMKLFTLDDSLIERSVGRLAEGDARAVEAALTRLLCSGSVR